MYKAYVINHHILRNKKTNKQNDNGKNILILFIFMKFSS